jgi:multidrug efflux pump subunit AcrA (membrane-fusion protein)
MSNSIRSKNQEVKMNKTLKIISLFVIMTFFTFFVFGSADTDQIKCPRKVKVQIEKINGSDFTIYKNFTADFSAEVVVVKTKVAGAVTTLSVAIGDEVSKDFPLAIINNALADKISEAEKNKKVWEKRLKGRENWKVRSDRAEAQAKAQIQKFSEELQGLQTSAENYKIISPVQGKVMSLNITQGQTIEEDTVLLKIINPMKKTSLITLSGQDSQLFSGITEIQVKSDGNDTGLKALVQNLTGDQVNLLIEDDNNQIQQDFTMEFSLEVGKLQNAVVLQKNMILSDENGSFVYIVNGKFAKKSYLKLGQEDGDRVLVKFGLKLNEEIITTGFKCLSEGKRIKVMVMDENGNLVKRRPGRTTKPVKIIGRKKPIKPVTEKEHKLPGEYKNVFKLGLGFGITMFSDENFKKVYSGTGIGVLFNFSYVFNNNYEVFLNVGLLGKTGTLPVVEEEVKFTMMPTYIGFKYIFDGDSIRPFVGLSAVVFAVKEVHKYNPDPALDTGYGFALLTGAYLELSPNFDLLADLRYEFGSKEIKGFETDDKASRNKFKIHFGFNYKF